MKAYIYSNASSVLHRWQEKQLDMIMSDIEILAIQDIIKSAHLDSVL
jgi:hypothetical protein